MTKARDLANLLDANGDVKSASLDNVPAVDLTNLSASNLTSGTIPDARVSASAVSQHATSFDDNKIVNDISTLALRQASNENKGAYNTNSMFVDVFQDDTGIASHTTSARNSSEYVSTAVVNVQPLVSFSGATAIGNMTQDAGLSSAIDGTLGGAGYVNGARKDPSTGATIGVDWGSGNSHAITRAKIWGVNNYGIAGNTSNRYGKLQGSNNNSSWTDLFTISNISTNAGTNTANTVTHDVNHLTGDTFSDISTAYRYHRWLFEGDVNGGTVSEIQFFTGTGGTTTNATGNFISNAITAPSSTSSMGAIITYQDQSGTNALNTDIVLQLSADGGSNYSTATLTALPDFSTGIKMAKVNDLAVTAGTSLKYKISFANQASGTKEARIRGVALQY